MTIATLKLYSIMYMKLMYFKWRHQLNEDTMMPCINQVI